MNNKVKIKESLIYVLVHKCNEGNNIIEKIKTIFLSDKLFFKKSKKKRIPILPIKLTNNIKFEYDKWIICLKKNNINFINPLEINKSKL